MKEDVPASLRQLAIQIKEADDEFGVASDLVIDANKLVEAAWDGSLCERIVGRKIRLADAIERSRTLLDAASTAYIQSHTAEVRARVGYFGSFDGDRFKRDTLMAFKSLKELNFTKLGTLHYNLIQSALTKHEELWSGGPLNDEVVSIQQFCMHVEAVTESLGDRTARRTSNDMVALCEKPNKSLSYNSAECRIHSTDKYPACVSGNFDWANLFKPHAKEESEEEVSEDDDSDDSDDSDDNDGDDGPWLTPRMAARIHHVALFIADIMLEDCDDSINSEPRLPRIARPFFKKSHAWRLSFRDCYVRIAMRLQKGLPPKPNCTGEEFAFHNIMDEAPHTPNDMLMLYEPDKKKVGDDEVNDIDIFERLPKFPNDNDYGMVRECAVQDDDVLDLFEEGDDGFSDSDEDETTRVDNPVHGRSTSFMLGAGGNRMGAVYLHPGEWFIAFQDKHFNNHLP